MTDEHQDRLIEFEKKHIAEVVAGMASQLRRHADSLDRIATREGSRPGWRASEAWSEIKAMNANLRVDILISSLARLAELAADETDPHR